MQILVGGAVGLEVSFYKAVVKRMMVESLVLLLFLL